MRNLLTPVKLSGYCLRCNLFKKLLEESTRKDNNLFCRTCTKWKFK